MPNNNFPQESSNSATLSVTVNGQSIDILPPYNPDASDLDQYVPSVQFRTQAHKSMESIANNLSGFFNIYNHWIKGDTKCDYTVVMEMTMRANLLASQFQTLSKSCKEDRFPHVPQTQLLTINEQIELIDIASQLNVSPSEVLTLIRKNINKVI